MEIYFQIAVRLPGVLFSVAGFFGMMFVFKSLRMGSVSRNWPQVPGIVTEACVERNDSGESVSYFPKISCSYEVTGRKYESRMKSYHGIRGGKRHSRKYLEKYPPGSEVAVYYDPEDASNAVLEAGVNKVAYCMAFVVCGFVMIAGLVQIFAPWPSLANQL